MELGCTVLYFVRKHPKSTGENFECETSNTPKSPKGDSNAGVNLEEEKRRGVASIGV